MNDEVCSQCDGRRVDPAIAMTQDEWLEAGCPMSGDFCDHCGGTGIEPE
ncbi:hypothetical protein [Vibrio alginolyticus]|nr:hypothetical protein [Vibrio alginolyticus]